MRFNRGRVVLPAGWRGRRHGRESAPNSGLFANNKLFTIRGFSAILGLRFPCPFYGWLRAAGDFV